MTTQTCHSDTHYIDAFFIEKGIVVDHKLNYYLEKEAHIMFKRIVNKYNGSDKSVLVVLRKANHKLVKSDWLKLNT